MLKSSLQQINQLRTGLLFFSLIFALGLLVTLFFPHNSFQEQRKPLQATKISSKNSTQLNREYKHGEVIVKFKEPLSGIKDKNNEDITSKLDRQIISYSDLIEASVPSFVQDMHNTYSIITLEKVFKGAQTPNEELNKFKKKYPGRVVNESELMKVRLNSTYTVSYEADISPERVAVELQKNPNIEYAEPNYIVETTTIPNDLGFVFLWNLHNNGQRCGYQDVDIDAPEAWDITTGNDSVIVAVIDTGVDYTHEDLTENMWINVDEIPDNGIDDDNNGYVDDIRGWNFSANNNNPFDDDGHGTHVSGTIGAVGNNTTGLVGVNWRVKIIPLKIFPGAYSSSIASAIHYANIMGAKVSNNSYGRFGGHSQTEYSAILESYAYNAIYVAAAGNGRDGVGVNTDTDPFYPAGYDLPNILSVAAHDCWDKLSEYSNYGVNTVDIVAPGNGIMSTIQNNSYSTLSGTSMASPHVAGAVALLLSYDSNDSADNIRYKILNNVEPMMNSVAGRIGSGGRLSVYKAIIDNTTYPTPTPLNTPTMTPTPIPTYQFSFTPDVVPSPEWDTAEELLDRLTLLSGVFTRDIARWDGSLWIGHVNNTPFNNFPIEVGEGYLIRFDPGMDTSIYSQLEGTGEISSSTYVMSQNAWSYIGISHNLLQSNSITDAETLCVHFGEGYTPETTVRYFNAQTQDWVTHQCQTNNNNFQISGYGNSFFINSTMGFNFSLQVVTPTPPLAILLDSFTAQWINRSQVRAEWVTVSEMDNLGFNIWRGSTPKEPTVKLNKTMIPSCSPGGTQGCSYAYLDTLPRANTKTPSVYYYWIEDIDVNGTITRHGPVGTDGSGGP
ncbi:MAG TPA: S8 family peptidase [Candidatus Woesebacteria bacterium]|nr:S8 family peptidase [Candidatus Woesebacteria bacterium]HNS94922.1 S8 family peptidase [Candidatus Woesebacteria bacterium]